MIDYFATCARGLEPILSRELLELGATKIEPTRGGVAFQGELETLYRANLGLRTAVRVLRPLKSGFVPDTDSLYEFTRTIKWFELMTTEQTLAIDCNVRDSRITHSQYAARRVKDGICDQFRDRTGLRPSVDVATPHIGLNLHIHRDQAILSLDSSWDSLHKRGYRPIQTRAPINEALAAGLLLQLGYDGSTPLVDFMAGSGTFAVEAAWIAMKRPPGLTRKWFGFFGWKDFDAGVWSRIRDEARSAVMAQPAYPPRGSDVRRDAIELAQANGKAAGLGHIVKFEKLDLKDARPLPGEPPGWIVLNPPYGERLGEEEELIPLYRKIGAAYAEHWPGWKLAVFTSNDRLAKRIAAKVERRTPFFNGALECKLWEFSN